jgi:hypothetical protein
MLQYPLGTFHRIAVFSFNFIIQLQQRTTKPIMISLIFCSFVLQLQLKIVNFLELVNFFCLTVVAKNNQVGAKNNRLSHKVGFSSTTTIHVFYHHFSGRITTTTESITNCCAMCFLVISCKSQRYGTTFSRKMAH